jgi:aryl-alcohol dehydrogenase-like predicted oxidoreductase
MIQQVTAAAAGTITLGGDLTVNRLGYGAMRITGKGIWGPPEDHDAAIATLRRAVELGVNFIDTADSYGPYVSEELVAEALAPYPPAVVIATKGGWERPGPGQWTHNASPDHLRKALEGSLERLRLDRIDVYQLHMPDNAVVVRCFHGGRWRNCVSRAKFAMSRCRTLRANTLSVLARSSPSFLCRIATASPIANGITLSTTAQRMASPLSLGRLSEAASARPKNSNA